MQAHDGGNLSAQCIRVSPNTQYYLGYRYKQTEDYAAQCIGKFFLVATCGGTGGILDTPVATLNVQSNAVGSTGTGWTNAMGTVTTPSNALSALVTCESTPSTASVSVYFDQVYLNTTGDAY